MMTPSSTIPLDSSVYLSPRTVDWKKVAEKRERLPWAAVLVDSMVARFREDMSALPEKPPLEQSEWSHHYYCDSCAARLLFDPALPYSHRCPSCGKIYADEMRHGAWQTVLHNAIMQNVERASVLARLQPECGDYAAYIRQTLLYYAGHYGDYPVHGARAGKGKVMPQSLDEAVWIIRAGHSLCRGKDQGWLSEAELNLLREGLFRPAAELLRPQIHKIHNIHVWLNSGVATCAWWLNDTELLDWTIGAEFGWKQQLEQGVNADGFWWENSIGYHFYSFAAFAGLALTAADAGRNLWGEEKLCGMLLAPLDLAFPDGSLPAHNDTWMAKLPDSSRHYELGSWAWPEAGLDAALGRIYRGSGPGCVRDSLEALLYGAEELPEVEQKPPVSRHFKASGLGILESAKARICLKAGPHGGGHDHRDKLNVDVLASNGWKSEDLGTSGYAAAITKRWYQQPAAHNVVSINQSRQGDVDAVMREFEADRMSGRVEEICPGISLQRSIELTPEGWRDRTWVEGSAAARIDWCFHGSGSLATGLPLEPVPQAGSAGGFDWLRKVRRACTDGDWEVEWKEGEAVVRLVFKGAPGTEIFLAEGDANPASQKLGVLIVRRFSAPTLFEGRFEVI